jgi:hypothetical protein
MGGKAMGSSDSVTLRIHPHFKMILLVVLALTVGCILVLIVLSFVNAEAKTMEQLPALHRDLYNVCKFGW